nr:hypothetical protein Iba_chr10fCG9460 [Ipomoea batatas]
MKERSSDGFNLIYPKGSTEISHRSSQEALRYLTGQPPSPPNFVVVPVFQQVEPSLVRLPIRPQVRIPSDSHGPAPLSSHRVAIDILAPADVQEETVQVEVEETRQVERLLILQPP